MRASTCTRNTRRAHYLVRHESPETCLHAEPNCRLPMKSSGPAAVLPNLTRSTRRRWSGFHLLPPHPSCQEVCSVASVTCAPAMHRLMGLVSDSHYCRLPSFAALQPTYRFHSSATSCMHWNYPHNRRGPSSDPVRPLTLGLSLFRSPASSLLASIPERTHPFAAIYSFQNRTERNSRGSGTELAQIPCMYAPSLLADTKTATNTPIKVDSITVCAAIVAAQAYAASVPLSSSFSSDSPAPAPVSIPDFPDFDLPSCLPPASPSLRPYPVPLLLLCHPTLHPRIPAKATAARTWTVDRSTLIEWGSRS